MIIEERLVSVHISDKGCYPVNCFSQTGQHHIADKLPCEDVYITRCEGPFRFYGLADGQTGKRFCAVGGQKVLTAIAQYVEDKTIPHLCHYEYIDELQYELIRVIRSTLSKLSEEYHTDISEFSSTIIAMAIDANTNDYLIIHLGDGSVVGINSENSTVMLSAPDNGITSQYTWLTTSTDAMKHLRIYKGSIEELKRIVLLTDGATMLCRGRNVAKKAEPILCDLDDPGNILKEIRHGNPLDDASCIVVDLGCV